MRIKLKCFKKKSTCSIVGCADYVVFLLATVHLLLQHILTPTLSCKVPWVRWLLTFWDAVPTSACYMYCLLSKYTFTHEMYHLPTVSFKINSLRLSNTTS